MLASAMQWSNWYIKVFSFEPGPYALRAGALRTSGFIIHLQYFTVSKLWCQRSMFRFMAFYLKGCGLPVHVCFLEIDHAMTKIATFSKM